MEGFVGISFDMPTTCAPNFNSQTVSQDPLNPVLPVIKTFLPLYIFLNTLFFIAPLFFNNV